MAELGHQLPACLGPVEVDHSYTESVEPLGDRADHDDDDDGQDYQEEQGHPVAKHAAARGPRYGERPHAVTARQGKTSADGADNGADDEDGHHRLDYVPSPPPMVARSVKPRIAHPLGVNNAKCLMVEGTLDEEEVAPDQGQAENQDRGDALGLALGPSHAYHQGGGADGREDSAGPRSAAGNGAPQSAPKAAVVTTPMVARLTTP